MPPDQVCETTMGYKNFEMQQSEPFVIRFTLKEYIGYGYM